MDTHLVRTPLTLGIMVRNARLEQHLSQAGTAERAQVSRSWLARVEDGHPGAELGPILRLLEALDLRIALYDAVDVDDTQAAFHHRDRDREEHERAARVLARITDRGRTPGSEGT